MAWAYQDAQVHREPRHRDERDQQQSKHHHDVARVAFGPLLASGGHSRAGRQSCGVVTLAAMHPEWDVRLHQVVTFGSIRVMNLSVRVIVYGKSPVYAL